MVEIWVIGNSGQMTYGLPDARKTGFLGVSEACTSLVSTVHALKLSPPKHQWKSDSLMPRPVAFWRSSAGLQAVSTAARGCSAKHLTCLAVVARSKFDTARFHPE